MKTQLAFRLGNSAFYSQAELGTYINEALRVWQLATGYWRATKSFNTVLNTVFYQINTTPNALIRALRVNFNTVPLELDSLWSMDQGRPGWEGDAAATPLRWFPVGTSHIGIHPKPDAVQALDVWGWVAAPVLSADADFVDIGQWQLGALYDYGHHLAAFKAAGAEFKASQAYFREFLKAAGRQNSKFKRTSIYRRWLGNDNSAQAEPVHTEAAGGGNRPTATQ